VIFIFIMFGKKMNKNQPKSVMSFIFHFFFAQNSPNVLSIVTFQE